MTNALRQKVKVQPGGVIEIRSPELTPGVTAEVIVLMETPEGESARAARVRELAELFKTTQALPQAQAISEDEIAAEIAVRIGLPAHESRYRHQRACIGGFERQRSRSGHSLDHSTGRLGVGSVA